ncbi:MAG: leucine-rich repeat domain-containing protein [Gammaproteobacteria bacterium]|nr:leucine-rich repeat domain-containing protein [Gammaproteobacteria bacterium]
MFAAWRNTGLTGIQRRLDDGGRLFPAIGRGTLCVVCFAVATVAHSARASEDAKDAVAAWDDPESVADRVRWEQAWLDEHRRRATAFGLDFAAQRAERSGLGDTSATDMLGFRDGSARPSGGAAMPACREQRAPGAGLPDAEAKECFPSIFDSYYSDQLSAIRPTAPPLGSPQPERTGPTAVPGRVGAFSASSDDEVWIPDAGLRAAITARLGKARDAPVTAADMAGLTALNAVGRGIVDLSGLRSATALQRLNLDRNDIPDLSELATLTELTHLSVDENFVADVAPVRDLAKLRSLSLADNLVRDIWPLAGLTDLRALDLGDNEVGNIGPLRGLEALTHLYLNDNRVESTWALENLRGLRILDLRNNRIQFVSPLSAMDRLTTLYLSENEVSDISWLSGLASLRQLSLGGNGVADISALAGLGNLTHLDLGGNMVTDLSPLSALSELTLLSLGGNGIGDISALADLSRLTLLDLAANRIADASPLAGLAELVVVDLNVNRLTRAPALSGAVDLKALSLAANRIADLSPLSGLTALRILNLAINAIEDISPLAALGRLDTLYLSANEITDLSPLSDLAGLVALYLSQNSLVDISPLRSLANLRLLSLGRNAIEELPDLAQLSRLTHLWLYENGITDIQALAALTRLRYLFASGNSIADLRPLSTLGTLEELWVSDNGIDNLSPVVGLSNLYVLSAPDNAIEDLSPVAGLAGLTQLNLIGNDVSDLSPLSDLRRLSWLWLRDNEVADVAPLVANADFGAGDYVDLRENPLDAQSISDDISTLVDRGVVVRRDHPDLVVDSPSASDEDLQAGASFTLSTTVRNQGAAAAEATTLQYYRSSDATIGTSDTEVGTDAVDGLLASESSAESIGLTAPSSSGTYYYGACVDSVEGESDTDNNCSTGVRVTVGSGGGTGAPDLVVDRPSVDDANPDAGDRIVVRATVRNRGDADSAATVLRWYRSGDSMISNNDMRVGTDPVSRLAPSSTSPESITLTVPSEAGTYYYGGCVDSVSGESNTGNNCSSGVRVSVSDGGGGTDSYCRAEDTLDPDDRCDIYSTNIDFYVSSSGQGCIQAGGILLCQGGNINHRNLSLNGQRYTLVATRSGNTWTISDVDPSPPD